MKRFVRVRDAPNNPGGRWVEDRDVVIPVIEQGLQGIPGLQGFKGDPGRSVQVFPQISEPAEAQPGDFWVMEG